MLNTDKFLAYSCVYGIIFLYLLHIQQIAILPLLSKSKTVFQPHRGDFKTLFEVFSFFVAYGLH